MGVSPIQPRRLSARATWAGWKGRWQIGPVTCKSRNLKATLWERADREGQVTQRPGELAGSQGVLCPRSPADDVMSSVEAVGPDGGTWAVASVAWHPASGVVGRHPSRPESTLQVHTEPVLRVDWRRNSDLEGGSSLTGELRANHREHRV